jgi:catechol 2,3-dioxygenase-like lactoylglutathione lyase family enzyme
VNHVGLTVADCESSVAFYRDVVGMRVVRRSSRPISGEWFDTLTEGEGAVIEAIILAADGLVLQLMHYVVGAGPPASIGHSRAGSLHLCINVPDVERLHREIRERGEYAPTPIVDLPIAGVRSFYVRDPDGVPVEFLSGAYVPEQAGPP